MKVFFYQFEKIFQCQVLTLYHIFWHKKINCGVQTAVYTSHYLNKSLILFKKPFSSGLMLSLLISANLRKASFCFSFSFCGTTTLILTNWSPRVLLRKLGMPLPFKRSTFPG